jgi:predicted transcriptional regulator
VVAAGDVARVIANVHAALAGLSKAVAPAAVRAEPAVSIRTSVKPDAIACLECGLKSKMLKRHLQTGHGLSPAEYRIKWNLPASYPMVAPNYAETRRQLALKIGLGRKKGTKVTARKPRAKAS